MAEWDRYAKIRGFGSFAGIGDLGRSTFNTGTDSPGNRAYVSTVVVHVTISVPENIIILACVAIHYLGRSFRSVGSACRNFDVVRSHRGSGLYIYCAAARILRGLRNFVSFPVQTINADLCLIFGTSRLRRCATNSLQRDLCATVVAGSYFILGFAIVPPRLKFFAARFLRDNCCFYLFNTGFCNCSAALAQKLVGFYLAVLFKLTFCSCCCELTIILCQLCRLWHSAKY